MILDKYNFPEKTQPFTSVYGIQCCFNSYWPHVWGPNFTPFVVDVDRIVFPHRKKTKKNDEIAHKKYILTSEVFEFGPLLVGKSRDK